MKLRLPQQNLEFSYDPAGLWVPSTPVNPGDPERRNPVIATIRHADSTADSAPMFQVNHLQAATIGVWMDGNYSSESGEQPAFPLRIEWKLVFGVGGCMADDDPPKGVTILKDATDFTTREGLFFQVDCRVMRTMWLLGRIIDDTPIVLKLAFRVLCWPLSGRPEVIVGTAIG